MEWKLPEINLASPNARGRRARPIDLGCIGWVVFKQRSWLSGPARLPPPARA